MNIHRNVLPNNNKLNRNNARRLAFQTASIIYSMQYSLLFYTKCTANEVDSIG